MPDEVKVLPQGEPDPEVDKQLASRFAEGETIDALGCEFFYDDDEGDEALPETGHPYFRRRAFWAIRRAYTALLKEQSKDVPHEELGDIRGRLKRRHEDQRAWLKEHAPECFEQQRHTEEGTQERVYWHYGYMMAIRDMLVLLDRTEQSKRPAPDDLDGCECGFYLKGDGHADCHFEAARTKQAFSDFSIHDCDDGFVCCDGCRHVGHVRDLSKDHQSVVLTRCIHCELEHEPLPVVDEKRLSRIARARCAQRGEAEIFDRNASYREASINAARNIMLDAGYEVEGYGHRIGEPKNG